MHWSSLPKESYSIHHEGHMFGPALTPEGRLPGVFNITWLLIAGPLEALLQYDGDPQDFPVSFNVTPAVVGTSLQIINGKTLGAWAEELTPSAWIELALQVPKLILTQYSPHWVLLAKDSAATFRQTGANVIAVDFRAGRVQ